jgi:hypothetical protein
MESNQPHKERSVTCSDCRSNYCTVCRSACPVCAGVHIEQGQDPVLVPTHIPSRRDPAPFVPPVSPWERRKDPRKNYFLRC